LKLFIFSALLFISATSFGQFEGYCLDKRTGEIDGVLLSVSRSKIVLDSCNSKSLKVGSFARLSQEWKRNGLFRDVTWSKWILLADVKVVKRNGRRIELEVVRIRHADKSEYNLYPVLDERFALGQRMQLISYSQKKCDLSIEYWEDNVTVKRSGCKCNGAEIGTWKAFYKSGALKSTAWHYGSEVIDGLEITFYESGDTLSIGGYEDREREGPWREFYPSGVLKFDGNYVNGKIALEYKDYHENGVLKSEGLYDMHDDKEELWKTYHENGRIASEIFYSNNEMRGVYRTYYSSGDTSVSGNYAWHGSRINEWRHYYPSGSIKTEFDYYYSGTDTPKRKEYFENGNLQELSYIDEDGDTNTVYKLYYPNGNLKRSAKFSNGQKFDAETLYFENGQVQTTGENAWNLKSGPWLTYDKEGNLLSKIGYASGNYYLHCIWYHPNGQLLKDVYYYDQGTPKNDYVEYYSNGEVKIDGVYGYGDLLGKKVGKWKLYYPTGKKKEVHKYKNGKENNKWISWDEDGKKTVHNDAVNIK
jgi:antitoxin component YwqK of YwqJK toxin-antitoxin module